VLLEWQVHAGLLPQNRTLQPPLHLHLLLRLLLVAVLLAAPLLLPLQLAVEHVEPERTAAAVVVVALLLLLLLEQAAAAVVVALLLLLRVLRHGRLLLLRLQPGVRLLAQSSPAPLYGRLGR